MVHLKHQDGFETYYLHLSAFGPGIRAGAHVAQGELIGRVGMTGSATGPHLDYRLKRNGVFVNPVAVHSRQAPGEPIPAVQLATFKSSRDTLLSRLSTTLLAEAPARQARRRPRDYAALDQIRDRISAEATDLGIDQAAALDLRDSCLRA